MTSTNHPPFAFRMPNHLLALIAAATLHSPSIYAQADNSTPPAVPVTVSAATLRDITLGATYTGRVEAIESVALQARVQGYLKAKHFTEGTQVEVGTLLFELEDDTYANAADQARASIEVAEAQEKLAQQTYDRQASLARQNLQSKADLDQARANLNVGMAQVSAARARLEATLINLKHTRIKAPISGRIGRAAVSTGALIGPQSGPLATIVQLDPVYVSFPVPQTTLLEVKRRGADEEGVTIRLRLADGSLYHHQGKLAFTDIQATAATDSIMVRVLVRNPDQLLIDRQLVDVEVVSNRENLRLTIPQQALLLDQQGAYVLAVDKDNGVRQVRIEPGNTQQGYVTVQAGLEEGDRVIVSGLQKIRPGTKVIPTTAANMQ